MTRNLAAVVAVVVAAGAAFWVARAGGGPGAPPTTTTAPHPDLATDREGSTVLTSAGELVTGPPPDTYLIRYRVSVAGVERSEDLTVRRPFDERLEVTAPHLADPQVTVTVLGRQLITGGGEPAVLGAVPDLAPHDLATAPMAADLAAAGITEVRERRRVAGLPCQVHRVGGPLHGGDVVPYDPAGDVFADVCIGARGLLLEEVVVRAGEVAERRVATAVDTGTPDDGLFAVPGELSLTAADGGAAVTPLAPDSRAPGDEFLELGEVPAPWRHLGRFAVVWPGPPADQPGAADRRVGSVADVLVDGPRAVIVERGGSRGGGDVFGPGPPARGAPADVTGFAGRAWAISGLHRNEVRVVRAGGRFVRAYGSADLGTLERILEGLRPVPGSELVPAPRPPGG